MTVKDSRLQKALEKCRNICCREKIPIGDMVQIKVSSRLVKAFGNTRRKEDGFEIHLSDVLFEDGCGHALESVLLHELLHTCPDCMNHGRRWQEYAARIQKDYPQYAIRCRCSYEQIGLPLPVYENWQKSHGEIKAVCVSCGSISYVSAGSRLARYPMRFHCGRCGGKIRIEKEKSC